MGRSVSVDQIVTQADELVENARRGEAVVVTHRGNPAFVLVDYRRYQGIQDSLDDSFDQGLLARLEADPEVIRAVEQGLRDIDEGRIISHEALMARIAGNG